MPFIRLCLIVFSALILTSCTFPEDGEPAEYPEFFGHADPAATLESISAAIRSGKVFIQDEKGYGEVFGFDSYRFNEKNIRPMNVSFIPGTNSFQCLALVMDSATEDNHYRVVFLVGGTDRNAVFSLVGVGKIAGEKDVPPPVLPEPSVVTAVCEAMQRKIQAGDISWEQEFPDGIISETQTGSSTEKKNAGENVQTEIRKFRYPESEWWKDRLTAQKGNLRLTEKDLSLCGISASRKNEITLAYCVKPLIVRTARQIVAYTVLDAVLDQDGSLLRTYEGGENSFENAFSVIIYPFTQKDNDAIYKTVFDYLFEQSALKAGQAVPAEKVRFLFVPETASPDFMAKYSWSGNIPVRSPFVRDWELPVPFNEKAGRYMGYGSGEFYYSAGAIRPVDDSTVYVMTNISCVPPLALSELSPEAAEKWKASSLQDASMRFSGPAGYLKLKKGFFGWYVDQDHVFSLNPPAKERTASDQDKP